MSLEGGTALNGEAPSRLAEITGNARIGEIRLVSLHADTKISSPSEAEKVMISLSSNGSPGAVRESGFDINTEVIFEVNPAGDEEAESDAVVHINSIFRLSYELPNAHVYPQEDLEEFASVNAVFNAWPYFREIVQSMLVRMGLPPVPIPLFRITNADPAAGDGPAPD